MVLASLSLCQGYFSPMVLPARSPVSMKEGGYMYDNPYAPEGMGREFIDEEGVRKPLSEYVGVSEELNLAAFFKGEPLGEPWDPFDFAKLSKVSANNPDVAFLREAELKHGRVAMVRINLAQILSTGSQRAGGSLVCQRDAGIGAGGARCCGMHVVMLPAVLSAAPAGAKTSAAAAAVTAAGVAA